MLDTSVNIFLPAPTKSGFLSAAELAKQLGAMKGKSFDVSPSAFIVSSSLLTFSSRSYLAPVLAAIEGVDIT